eukprot:4685028-Prymnesium_polylepis.1
MGRAATPLGTSVMPAAHRRPCNSLKQRWVADNNDQGQQETRCTRPVCPQCRRTVLQLSLQD